MPLPSQLAWWPFAGLVLGVLGLHLIASPFGEPFKNNDETRHVMTGVFVHDAFRDASVSFRDPKSYAIRYYSQYPALGLLVWPPLFYLVEGVAMLALGPTYFTARVVLTGFVLLAAAYTYRLTGERFGTRTASLATGLFLISPLVFDLSRYCLLEVPTLALVLASVYHFERYLEQQRPRDAWLACILAAAASLTRFDGVVLLTYFAIRLLVTYSWHRLLDRAVLGGLLCAVSLTAPYYAFTWWQYREGLQAAAVQGTASFSTGLFSLNNLYLYVHFIPGMLGQAITIIGLFGLYRCIQRSPSNVGPFLGLIIATYVTFVPLAEPEPRHAIYWVPAWCLFAAIGLRQIWERAGRRAGIFVLILVIASTLWNSIAAKGPYLRGYFEAASYCHDHRTSDRPWLVDGTLTGAFVFQSRQVDPQRQTWVLRGDKLLYAVLSDANAKYIEYTIRNEEVLELLIDHDPEFIVVENPSLLDDLPTTQRLRFVLRNHPDQFELVYTVAFDTNHYLYQGKHLEVWRKLQRNPKPKSQFDIPVLGLGRALQAEQKR